MLSGWLYVLTIVAALGSGLTAGALYAFSAFVMRALVRLPAFQGIAAMQVINVEAPKPPFMAAFVGTAVLDAVLVVMAVVRWGEPYAPYVLLGAAVYLVGVIGLTAGYHVPRNNALAAVEPTDAVAADLWSAYARRWTAWNHVRVAAALAASALFTIAVRVS